MSQYEEQQKQLGHRNSMSKTFGNIKQNKKFTRFLLRGKDNVIIEAGLVALAVNVSTQSDLHRD